MTFQPRQSSDSSPGTGPLYRPLYIDFGIYAEDQASKKELGLLLIDNLIEFRRSLTDSIQQNNPKLFLEASHKVTVTLSVLEDKEFNDIIEELKRDIVNLDKYSHGTPRLNHFQAVCDLIIISLRKEINGTGS